MKTTTLLILLTLLTACAVSPPIKPDRFLTPSGHVYTGEESIYTPAGPGYVFDQAAYDKADAARKRLQHAERWTAFWCDAVSTVAVIATHGGSELGGNALLAVKIPVGYWAQQQVVAEAEREGGSSTPLNIVNTVHWGACVYNLVGG